jgi:hypothetical protein
MSATLPEEIAETLKRADRHSEPVRVTFRDGGEVTVRIRELDWHNHHTVTYMDMDGACGIRVARLEDIVSVRPA